MVKECPGCATDVRPDERGVFPAVCPNCGESLLEVEAVEDDFDESDLIDDDDDFDDDAVFDDELDDAEDLDE